MICCIYFSYCISKILAPLTFLINWQYHNYLNVDEWGRCSLYTISTKVKDVFLTQDENAKILKVDRQARLPILVNEIAATHQVMKLAWGHSLPSHWSEREITSINHSKKNQLRPAFIRSTTGIQIIIMFIIFLLVWQLPSNTQGHLGLWWLAGCVHVQPKVFHVQMWQKQSRDGWIQITMQCSYVWMLCSGCSFSIRHKNEKWLWVE